MLPPFVLLSNLKPGWKPVELVTTVFELYLDVQMWNVFPIFLSLDDISVFELCNDVDDGRNYACWVLVIC